MINKIPALITAALILGSTSMASAAVQRVMPVEDSGAYATPVGGGYSANPETRRLELLADKYNGWAEYIQ
jgi:hypothetical protein